MRLDEVLAGQPPVYSIPGARAEIRRRIEASGRRLVVVDDDPTGTQTVHGVSVYMDWSTEQLRRAFALKEPVFYLSTNSRGLGRQDVIDLCLDLGRNLREAAEAESVEVIVASRSDSTLRGHFPYEVDALLEGLGKQVDGVIIAPAFFEAGRYTVDDVHYVDGPDGLVPASETEFAKDPVFGYTHSNLREWVEEKTGGKMKAGDVRSISLETIRSGGPEAVAGELMKSQSAEPVVVNVTCYEDLEVFALGLSTAEAQGKVFAYRCAACLVTVKGGIEDRPILTRDEMRTGPNPGLVVVGSYVGKTSRQLEALFRAGLAEGREIRVDRLLDACGRESEVREVADWVDGRLSSGRSAVVYTSRATHYTDKDSFLQAGSAIMSGLCGVLHEMRTKPGFLVAKGGITSIEVARTGLGVKQAWVLGQILKGIPVWKLGEESQWSGIPYIVFPGNVGDDEALLNAVSILTERAGK